MKYSLGAKNNAKKYEGWNDEGVDKFNELVPQIKEDRVGNSNFDEYFGKIVYVYSEGRYGTQTEKEHVEDAEEKDEPVMQLEEV